MVREGRRGRFCVAMTGASGAPYGLRLVEVLLAGGHRVHLVISDPGRRVLALETGLELPADPAGQERALVVHLVAHAAARGEGSPPGRLSCHGHGDLESALASGSSALDGTVICPCSMGTLAGIAAGTSRNLIERAADVALKERRRLVLVPRETPLSAIHLRNMLEVTRAGAVVAPAMPAFYQRPENVSDQIDFVVARVLALLGIDHRLYPRWREEEME